MMAIIIAEKAIQHRKAFSLTHRWICDKETTASRRNEIHAWNNAKLLRKYLPKDYIDLLPSRLVSRELSQFES